MSIRETRAVEVHDLVVACDRTTILHGVTLDVAQGEWVTIIGPNGAGKSTLLRAMGGLLSPTSGSVSLFGKPLGQMTRRQRAQNVAMVGQTPVVPPGIGVLDYVLLGRTPYVPMLGRESRADLAVVRRALNTLDLGDLATRPLETLSGGERQRVFLARALAQEGRLLLMDEPTTALDIGHQQDLLDLVDQLREAEGLTVVATTHELSVAGEYADRLVLMAGGRIAAAGCAEEVLTADLLAQHYGARVRVLAGDHGPIVIPVRGS